MKRSRKFVTAKEVAEVFGLHPKSVRCMAREDRIEAVKVGTRWRFPRSLIEVSLGNEKSPSTGDAD